MKLRSSIFMLVLELGVLGLVRDVITNGGAKTKDALMLAFGALGLAQDVTSNGGVGQTGSGKSAETTAKDRAWVTEIVTTDAAGADDKAA